MSELCNVSGKPCVCLLPDGECSVVVCNYKDTEYCEYGGEPCPYRKDGICTAGTGGGK